MFSKTEYEYLKGKIQLSKSYRRVLDHRIREKLKRFFEVELLLLEKRGITEFYNSITENNNGVEKKMLIYSGEGGIRTPIDRLCRPTHSRSATSPQSKKLLMNN